MSRKKKRSGRKGMGDGVESKPSDAGAPASVAPPQAPLPEAPEAPEASHAEPVSDSTAATSAAAARPATAPKPATSTGPRVLRVGIDARSLQPGFREDSGRGIGVYARELIRALAVRHDLALTLWFEPALTVPAGAVPPGVTARQYARTLLPLRDRWSSQVAVPLAAASGSHDVFHWLAHMHAPLFPVRHGLVTVHDLILEQFADLYPNGHSVAYRAARALEARALRHARTMVADSYATREDLLARHQVPLSRVHVAPLGVHPRFAPATAVEVAAVRKHHGLNAPFVLYLGGIDARKDLPVLLEAFARVRAQRSEPLLLVLAGHVLRAPEYPALQRRAEELKLGDALRVLEFVPLEHLAMLLTAARVFAFPSRCEGFGLPPLEAMACGTPVVSSRGGSLAEVLGEAALTVEPGDAEGFARELLRALDDDALRAHLRTQGLDRAASYTWTRTAEATVAAYRAAAHGGHRA